MENVPMNDSQDAISYLKKKKKEKKKRRRRKGIGLEVCSIYYKKLFSSPGEPRHPSIILIIK